MDPRVLQNALNKIASVFFAKFPEKEVEATQPRGMVYGDPNQMKITYGMGGSTPQVPAVQTPRPTMQPNIQGQKRGRNPEFHLKPMTDQVRAAIEGASSEFGVPVDLLYDVGFSEGGFRADAKNETPEGIAAGIPKGLYQFTPGTWENDLANYAKSTKTSFRGFDPKTTPREDPVANARAAAYLIKHGQLGRWEASMPNWGRFYSAEELDPYFAQTPKWTKTNQYYEGK